MRELAEEKESGKKKAARPLTSHWRSTMKTTFQGIEGAPAKVASRLRDDMPQVAGPKETETEGEFNVLEMARNHALKSSPSKETAR